MSRWFRILAVLFLAAVPAFAQEPDQAKIREINQRVQEAINGKRWGDGIKLLEELLTLTPEHKGTAYNLACLESLESRVDKAFEWIGKAADWGWGAGYGTIVGNAARMSEAEMCKTDPDLESLRKDARWEPVMAKITANFEQYDAIMKKGEAYAAEPALYVPAAIKSVAEKPLLVVVHDNTSTKDAVITGFWKQVADELGFALVAPSGKVPVGKDPKADGMLWFADASEYVANKDAWRIEKPIHDAVKFFKKTDKYDTKRVILVGEGGAGAHIAFGAGLSSPGLYKAVLGVDGAFEAKVVKDKGPASAKMGQRAGVLLDAGLFTGAPEAEQSKAGFTKVLADAKLGVAELYSSKKDDPKVRVKVVADAVRKLLEPAPGPAGAAPAPAGGTPAPAGGTPAPK